MMRLRRLVIFKELVDAARKAEMEMFKKHGVCEKVPIEESWESAGKAPVWVKWVDANKRQGEPRAQVQVGGQGDQEGRAGGSVRSDATFGGEEDVVLTLGKYARDVFGLRRCGSRLLSCEGKEKSVCGAVNGGLRGGQVWTAEESHARDP